MSAKFLLAALTSLSLTLSAHAEFLDPDWSDLTIPGVVAPDWTAGPNDGNYIGMCLTCAGSLMLQVEVQRDDGTGTRVHSGITTVKTYDELGRANAENLGKPAAYYGTEPISFASARGFATEARAATGAYSATYQLWSDNQQLIVRVFGDDRAAVDALAKTAYDAAAPLTFR